MKLEKLHFRNGYDHMPTFIWQIFSSFYKITSKYRETSEVSVILEEAEEPSDNEVTGGKIILLIKMLWH